MTWLAKSSALDRLVSRFKRKQARETVKRQLDYRERLRLAAIRIAVFDRDKGRSRASGFPVKLSSQNPELLAHCHHIVFRSAGGVDDAFNRCLLTPREHEDVHQHRLDVEGNGNGTLTFRQRDLETGRIVREWESTCPS